MIIENSVVYSYLKVAGQPSHHCNAGQRSTARRCLPALPAPACVGHRFLLTGCTTGPKKSPTSLLLFCMASVDLHFCALHTAVLSCTDGHVSKDLCFCQGMRRTNPSKTQQESLSPLPSAAPLAAAARRPPAGTAAHAPSAHPALLQAVAPEGTGVPRPRGQPGTCLSAGEPPAGRPPLWGGARPPGGSGRSTPACFTRLLPPPFRRGGRARPRRPLSLSLASQVSGAGGTGAARSWPGGRHEALSAAALPVAGEGGRLQRLPRRRLRGGCRLCRFAGCFQGACRVVRKGWRSRDLGGGCECEGIAWDSRPA